MKKTLLLITVATLAVSYISSAVVSAPGNKANLTVGNTTTGDRLLASQYLYRAAIYNTIQSEDFVYRGLPTTNITYVRAKEVGYTQYATAWITSGGLRANNVTVRVQSARGYGYYYFVDVWGR